MCFLNVYCRLFVFKLSSFKRQVRNPVANSKVNGNYVHSIVALNEALEDGFDEALMLDSEGFIAEGSGENFFLVKNVAV